MYTILHLSDLHRSPVDPASNTALLASLLSDRSRWAAETTQIPHPDAIVVSGDVIQGVGLGEPDYQQKLSEQYEVASDFLGQLADRFLSGDRSKVIIVPGNHDICWNTAYQAMEEVPTGCMPSNIPATLKDASSPYRWSWKDLKLYKIIDWGLYAEKLTSFNNFRKAFYQNTSLAFMIDDKREYQFFELDNKRILVSAFSSVRSNDCYSEVASFDIDTIGECSLSISDNCREYRLKMAVWHHSLYGEPHETSYLSAKYIHEMNNHGFQLGLHGHQHVASVNAYRICLSETSKAMAIASVGSLCAGAKELPRGVNRQYNVIVIGDDYLSANVHIREMDECGQFRMKNTPLFQGGYAAISWSENDLPCVNPDKKNFSSFVEKVERLQKNGKYSDVIKLIDDEKYLLEVFRDDPYLRILISEIFSAIGKHAELISFLEQPIDPAEATFFTESLIDLRRFQEAESLMGNGSIIPGVVKDKLMAKMMMLKAQAGN